MLRNDGDIVSLIAPAELLMTPTEYARYLRIGKRTFHTWKAAGRLPVPDLQIGKSLRWRRSTVDRWLVAEQAKRISA